MDSEIIQRLVRVIYWGGYGAAVFCFGLGFLNYLAGYTYFFGERLEDMRDGAPLMWWGVGLFVATAVALYILEGRTPITRDTPAKLLSPAIPYSKLVWAPIAVVVFGFGLLLPKLTSGDPDSSTRTIDEVGVWFVILGVLFVIIFGVMVLIVNRKRT